MSETKTKMSRGTEIVWGMRMKGMGISALKI